MVVLFGILALVPQFFHWAEIVKGLNDRLVKGSGQGRRDDALKNGSRAENRKELWAK
jgi:hypothetical protein